VLMSRALMMADTRLTEQNLASFSDSHAVLRGDFVGNIVRTNDVVNAHGISITRSLPPLGWLMLSYVSTAFSIVSCWLTPNYSAESRTKYYTKGDHGFWHSYAFTAGNFHEPIQPKAHSQVVTESAYRTCHLAIGQAINTSHSNSARFSYILCHGKEPRLGALGVQRPRKRIADGQRRRVVSPPAMSAKLHPA